MYRAFECFLHTTVVFTCQLTNKLIMRLKVLSMSYEVHHMMRWIGRRLVSRNRLYCFNRYIMYVVYAKCFTYHMHMINYILWSKTYLNIRAIKSIRSYLFQVCNMKTPWVVRLNLVARLTTQFFFIQFVSNGVSTPIENDLWKNSLICEIIYVIVDKVQIHLGFIWITNLKNNIKIIF